MRKLFSILSDYKKKHIYFVTSDQQWAFYWNAKYITDNLNNIPEIKACITANPWKIKRSFIHFIDRYLFLMGDVKALAKDNALFVTWYHGEKDDTNPDMQKLFQEFPQAAQYADKVVTSCKRSEIVLHEMGLPKDKIVIIPIGVDLNIFAPPTPKEREELRKSFGIDEGTICIGSFQKDGSGWGEGMEPKLVKGPDILVQTIEKVYMRNKNIKVILTGPARGYVKKALDKIGVSYIHEYLSNYLDVVRYYKIIDLYLITSRAEGGPMAFLESWATGVPVVSSKMGMPADIISHGEDGFLAEVGDVDKLADYVLELVENKELRELFRNNALIKVKEYDWPKIAQQHSTLLYKPLLAKKG